MTWTLCPSLTMPTSSCPRCQLTRWQPTRFSVRYSLVPRIMGVVSPCVPLGQYMQIAPLAFLAQTGTNTREGSGTMFPLPARAGGTPSQKRVAELAAKLKAEVEVRAWHYIWAWPRIAYLTHKTALPSMHVHQQTCAMAHHVCLRTRAQRRPLG
jgi:hypothetical protein